MRYFRCLFLPLLACLSFFWMGCGVYSLTGASITGKTINIRTLENRAMTVSPTLATVMTDKLRNRILSQTGLAAVNTETADYDMKAAITGYNVAYSGVQTAANGVPQASQQRLTITVEVDFKNKIDEKASFRQAFSRFYDFRADQQLQAIEAAAIEDISTQLADDIFNKAFVNW